MDVVHARGLILGVLVLIALVGVLYSARVVSGRISAQEEEERRAARRHDR
jgi:hypothetical protein